MRVLVTGGAGRLGVIVCRALIENGLKVRIFDLDTRLNRRSVKDLAKRAEVFWGDITKPDSVREAFKGTNALVHMAALIPPTAYKDPEKTAKVNVGGTRLIVDLLKERGGHLPFVYTSSVAVFGPTPDATELLSPEKNAPHPQGAYGKTKLKAENLIREAGVDFVILRLSATMYPIFKTSDLGRMFTIPLNNRIEFSHTDDTALAILNAIKNFDSVKGNTLVISGGAGGQMIYREMISAILSVLGLPLPPAHKFTLEPYYLDWYDTTRSQQLLRFQRKTFVDYLEEYSRELSRRYSPLFPPFMRYFVGPVFGKAIALLVQPPAQQSK